MPTPTIPNGKEIADIKTADMLDLPVPTAVFHNISVKPSEIQKQMVAELAERAERVLKEWQSTRSRLMKPLWV